MSRFILGVTLATFVACGGGEKTQPPTAAVPQTAPKITFEKYKLPNGLEVILSDDKRLPMVSVNIWYHVGPANEEKGRTGFAHLFEHMMFQGSKHVPPNTHFKFLESAGASEVNGTTDFDRTNYFETVPSNQIELALWLESDRMGYLLDQLDAAEFANQQDVVRNERRQNIENEPYGIAEEAVVNELFPLGHPYHANVMGSHQDIQAAKLDDVKRFFKEYYTPNNATLAIVGDFDKEPTKALVEKYFGTLKKGDPVRPVNVETPSITAEKRKVVTDRIELPRVYVAWLTPGYFKPGDADADMTATILGGGKSSRLYKHLVYDKQIAQDATASQGSLALKSMFEIEVTARPGHTAEELEKAIDAELDALRQTPPTDAEIERARNTIQTHLIEGLEKQGGFGGVADRLQTYNHYLGTPDYLSQDLQRYDKASAASVHDFVVANLSNSGRLIVYAEPGKQELAPPVPTPPAAKAKPGEGTESVNADEAWRGDPPKPGAMRPLNLPVPQSAELANGLKVILNQRTGMPVVAADLVVRSGGDSNPNDKPGLAAFAAALLDEGTASRTAPQIADELAQLGASLTTSSTMDASFVAGQSLTKNFPRTLDLLADVATHPAFPAEEIERQRASRLADIVQQRSQPQPLASRITAAALWGEHHPYGYPAIGTEASIKAISRDDMSAFWKQNFVPNNAALVVAGDISMQDLKALADKAFSGWAKGTAEAPKIGAAETTHARVIIVDKPGAPSTTVRVAGMGVPRSTPDFHPIEVMNMSLGGLFSSRINMNLREEHGYTYGASSTFVFRRAGGYFVVGGDVRSDATAPSVTEILKELGGMKTKPLTPTELQMSKDSLARSVPAMFETSGSAAGTFADTYVYDLGLDYFSKYGEQTEAVTADAAAAAAQKYVQPDKLVIIAVGDRAKIQPALEKLKLGSVEVWNTDAKPAK
jgi:zinc protease